MTCYFCFPDVEPAESIRLCCSASQRIQYRLRAFRRLDWRGRSLAGQCIGQITDRSAASTLSITQTTLQISSVTATTTQVSSVLVTTSLPGATTTRDQSTATLSITETRDQSTATLTLQASTVTTVLLASTVTQISSVLLTTSLLGKLIITCAWRLLTLHTLDPDSFTYPRSGRSYQSGGSPKAAPGRSLASKFTFGPRMV